MDASASDGAGKTTPASSAPPAEGAGGDEEVLIQPGDVSKKPQIVLSWEELTYEIAMSGGCCSKEKVTKTILEDCTGKVTSGDLLCIMGPSGSGKTSIMNTIAGRTPSDSNHKLSGHLNVNGVPVDTQFRNSIAYVMQEDALLATTTPREALRFSARLRLPKTVSFEEQDKKCEEMLNKLGLLKCADTMVGSVLIKGISGGEKKRTAIGVELITDPHLLFLDEPTSGLDSYAAFKVVKILETLADGGCGVVCTIHQPSSEVFSIFRKCILMMQGHMLYNSTISGLNDFFADVLERPCPEYYNPADHVMYVMQTTSVGELTKMIETKGHSRKITSSQANVEVGQLELNCGASFCTQLRYLVQREYQNTVRNKQSLGARFGMAFFLNLLFALIFFQEGNTSLDGYSIQGHFGCITLVSISLMFGSAQPLILAFPIDRPVFIREYATGTYGGAAYVISKLLIEAPLTFLQNTLAITIVYFLVDFQGLFIYWVLNAWLLSMVAASIAVLLGSMVTSVETAMQLMPAMFVPQFLFAGFFLPIEDVPEFLRWCQYLCSLKYSINLTLLIEFNKQSEDELEKFNKDSVDDVDCANFLMASKFPNTCLLQRNEVNPDAWYIYFLILLGIFFLFRGMGLFFLIKKARDFA